MMNLVHPGLLGTPKMFQKLFAGSELGRASFVSVVC
jgi:hypothetical protein